MSFRLNQNVAVPGGHQGVVLEIQSQAVLVQLGNAGRRWYWESEVQELDAVGRPKATPYYDDNMVD